MTWIDKLHELGVTPLEGIAFSPISDGELKQFEATIGNALPDDYRDFLGRFGDCDLEEYGVFPTEGGGVAPGTFFGRHLPNAISDFGERLPRLVVPINDDGAGNLICISMRPDSYGAIYFQSHSAGWDTAAEDLDAAKQETLVRLASSFGEFICGLVVE